jgi:hypothetical protein
MKMKNNDLKTINEILNIQPPTKEEFVEGLKEMGFDPNRPNNTIIENMKEDMMGLIKHDMSPFQIFDGDWDIQSDEDLKITITFKMKNPYIKMMEQLEEVK